MFPFLSFLSLSSKADNQDETYNMPMVISYDGITIFTNPEAQNDTHLLSLSFHGSGAQAWVKLSPHQAEIKVLARAAISFKAQGSSKPTDCWQNSTACSEVPVFLLVVGQGCFQILEATLRSLPHGPLHWQFTTLLFASSRPAQAALLL